ncbi:hypothetical protein JMA_27160 [Jeotgalibacillus malaysiensis]|uniref:DNA-packaging protein n=1 Tax=Jeotgalibacillus malaysiensis TaxID=1508404 RepID=A0A0B5ATY2_9BACL|nr:head-tail connector protein [Jeotgalibacillus malaysiensis]AJD92033.1 hypothetical protein JMA_27160 [Jeotgalibacillus malaysiensis]
MLEKVKKALRISNTAYDDEITDLIAAARDDLMIAGVLVEATTEVNPDPLITRAIVTYCKANFGYDNQEADRFHDAYVMLKQHLALSAEYRSPEVI